MSGYTPKKVILYGFVYILLGISNLMIKTVSFKKMIRFIANSDTENEAQLTPEKRSHINSLKRAIVSVSRRTPWRSKCYEQAVAASLLLKMIGVSHRVYFGLHHENAALKAHVWLVTDDICVTGFGNNMRYAVVSVFSHTSKKDRVHYV